MIRTRHRLLAYLACIVALGVAQQALAQSSIPAGTPAAIMPYNTVMYYGSLDLGSGTSNAGGYINTENSAIVVPTASFAYDPDNIETQNLYGTPGLVETGSVAIHDALYQGHNPDYAPWAGSSGIVSTVAATDMTGDIGIGYINNAIKQYTSFEGFNLTTCQIPGQPAGTYYTPSQLSIISVALIGDTSLSGLLGPSNLNDLIGGENAENGSPGGAYDGSSLYQWEDGNFYYNAGLGPNDLNGLIAAENDGTPNPMFNGGGGYSTVIPAGAAGGIAAVPEPSCLVLLFGSAISLATAFSVRRFRPVAA